MSSIMITLLGKRELVALLFFDLWLLTLCYFVLVFFSPFSIAITSLGEERANLSAFRTFV